MEVHQRARMAVKQLLLNSKSIESFPSKICMMVRRNLENLNRRSLGGGNDDGGDGSNEVLGYIYSNGASASCVGSSAAGYKLTNLQIFDFFPSLNSTAASGSSGVMASSVGLAFTSAQWKELERQAMIFKYLTASLPLPLPLPRDLLYPLSLNFPAPASDPTINLSGGELYNARCFKNRDPEPGRCKRTDGKKWRCSKDVAPLQKYCERHLHKGRLRSRKPVEVRNNGEIRKKSRLERGPLPTLQAYSAATHQISTKNEPHLLFNPIESDRDAGSMMEFESTENNWRHLMTKANLDLLTNEFSTCSPSPIFHQDCVETSSPFSYLNFQAQTGVVNAWSMDYESSKNCNATSCPVPLHQGNLSPSLNLSMAVASGNVLDGETSKFEIEHGLKYSDDCYVADRRWLPFSRGGPLGEALQPLVTGVEGSNPASPYDSVHTTATTVSSPSGVLHRTLFSQSENSVCNSPAGTAPSLEYAFQWFS
ncbi:growth-regulating factor 7-like isoform X1 [Primulina huaijiensis]|uniref:growth-regulating factor 7-like isoform X1 n=2 Tax=Primulina huaijiensis TaxID=1492673 RepID=UPI003CC77AEE